MNNNQETDYSRVMIAVFLSALLLITWQSFVEAPKRQKLAELNKSQQLEKIEKKANYAAEIKASKASSAENNVNLTHKQRLALSSRVAIRSDKLHGSIALKGARFDDLTLAKYNNDLSEESEEVSLLIPNGDEKAYFAQIGWLATDGKTKVPDHNSMWQADKTNLTSKSPTTLRWKNGQGVTFILSIALDDDYMFTINQSVENNSSRNIQLAPYAYINRQYVESGKMLGILHEGPIGVLEDALNETSYSDLRDDGSEVFEKANGWLGITDKYWITALIPDQKDFKGTFSHYERHGYNRYQADYLGKGFDINNGGSHSQSMRLFAGAKEIDALDRYTTGDASQSIPPIQLFDRAVDFGVLYFMTKPMFLTLKFFFALTGNFGVAILILTFIIKLLMFPLANKSYHSMAQMRAVQPQIKKIRDQNAGDSATINKETMALYKKEKINPASGCLPILIQMPVFFALYKVLYVTIEMRHAPFFGWLTDLSAPDPSNIFTLFGLIPWDHPSALHIGVLPILFCLSMVIQMKQQPKPADPIQAKVMMFMPYMFLYLFATFPAGLVLYWVCSNILSIIQQQVIIKGHNAKQHRKNAT